MTDDPGSQVPASFLEARVTLYDGHDVAYQPVVVLVVAETREDGQVVAAVLTPDEANALADDLRLKALEATTRDPGVL